MPAVEHGPTARHRRLAAELRRLREQAGLTPEVAAGVVGWSRTKLVRIETAKAMPSVADVERILEAYGGSSVARGALIELARDIRRRGWWASYDDVLAGSYAQLEDAADRIRMWQTEVPPGLVQDREYARTLIQGEFPNDPAEVDRRLQARMMRRARLARADAPEVDVIVAEEALRRPVGGPKVMAAQLSALLEEGQRSKISIRVVPIAMGYRPALGQGNMIIFEFRAALELDTAYVETPAGGMYIEDIAQVRACNVTLDRIGDAALSAEESALLIAAIREEMTQPHDR
ncbi:helix-turn-helix domain-containing protein [Actinomadura adrarensis]|uniref:Helix-turn-helix domain-containing protein n=1 Tax=Actinomadura adrarensis TaxID=1819600 RepID=A0ABW3CT10_9ACTN